MTAGLVEVLSAASFDVAEALEIAVDAYTYAYPLILMDRARRLLTDREQGGGAPINQFSHVRHLPGRQSEGGVRANLDALHSSLWFDVSKEPLIVNVPDSGGRFFSLSFIDHWSEAFATPGARTTGTGAQRLAILGPFWQGSLPQGIRSYRSPTGLGRIVAFTRVNGPDDLTHVASFQASLSASAWSAWGRISIPVRALAEPCVPRSSPSEAVARLSAADFFAQFCKLTRHNPPHQHDYPLIDRILRLGITPGRKLEVSKLSQAVQLALESASSIALPALRSAYQHSCATTNHWRRAFEPRGVFGTDYALRAGVALARLEAADGEDCMNFEASCDADGNAFDASQRYMLTFARGQLPPTKALWSLTLYDDQQGLAPNSLNRFALSDQDQLIPNADGSVSVHIQRESPGPDAEHNWLPSPRCGAFGLSARVYSSRPEVSRSSWLPPPVRRLDETRGSGRNLTALRSLQHVEG